MANNADLLYEGQYLSLYDRNGWEFIHRRHGVVMLVAMTDDNELLLVEQFRQPLQAAVIELPAGLVGDHGEDEDPEPAAIRELEEETGYLAGCMERMLVVSASPGMANEKIHIFRATQLVKTGEGGGDESENIIVHCVPLADVPRWLVEQSKRGVMIDGRVYAGVTLAGLSADELPGW